MSALALVDTSLERFDQEEIDSEKIAAEQRILARGKKILEIEEILKIQSRLNQQLFLADEIDESSSEKNSKGFLNLLENFKKILPFPEESLDEWLDRCQKIQKNQRDQNSYPLPH